MSGTPRRGTDQYDLDLGADNVDVGADERVTTAYDLKETHRQLQGFQDDELKQIPIVPHGSRLQQGSTYIDLKAGDRSEFTATGDMTAEQENAFVLKSDVDYQLWNRLIGVDNPERAGQADEP